jgi:hypothetical protein
MGGPRSELVRGTRESEGDEMRKLILLVLVMFGLSSVGMAGACGVGTMASYLGTSCTIGSLTFSNFSYSSASFGGATAVPAAGVTVTPITGSEVGFEFEAPWIVSSAQGLDSTIDYTVTGPITDLILSMAGYGITDGGDVSVAETSATPPLSLLVFDNSTGSLASDSVTGLSLTTLTVTKDIAVLGNGGTAGLSIVNNEFSTGSVPEPASMLLLGSGLLALAGYARRRKQTK